MNETTNETPNSPAEEQIRKVYVKDLKRGEAVHTVFKVAKKELHQARSGKAFLALSLVDRTGEVDGRVFDNVEAADGAFALGDYLLLQGKIGVFHGKSQVLVDRLERLDPGPIDPKEFEWTAPPEAAREPAKESAPKEPLAPREPAAEPYSHKAARARLLRLLDDPAVVLGLDALVRHLERNLTEGPPPKGPRVERKPRLEHRARADRPEAPTRPEKPEKHEPKRDPSLPEGLSFKPLTALVGEPPPAPPAPAAEPPADNSTSQGGQG